ncbi:MAG: TatD family hydrolase [Dysgonamonadaceae bacterium]|jgi:TatD DNase family protein|nr:TatD family hydrolase [Dysgonamonadaceae bacterium]
MELYDIHTHQIFLEDNDDPYHSCILDVYPLEFEVAKESYQRHCFSCGIHPWYAEDSENQLAYLAEIASDPRIVAIGETGLDKLKGPSYDVQIPVFKKHIELSENLGKPVIVHCVKAWDELIRVRKETNPSQPWIIHGYRGKPELTKRLVKEGFMFSFGDDINVDSMQFIPQESMFCETDEDEMDIRDVYLQAAQALDMEIKVFAEIVTKNVRRVFPSLEHPLPYDPKAENEKDDE